MKLADCGTLYFTNEYDPETGERVVVLEGNDTIGVSQEMLEYADPRFFKQVSEGVYQVAQYQVSFLEHSEYPHFSFYKVSLIETGRKKT